MIAELRTLFWLQWKLTVAMFRSHRLSALWWAVELLLRIISFVFSLPLILALGAGLAAVLMMLSPTAAYELTMLVNCGIFFLWLLLPASYNSQIVERFEMSRLFVYPIHFRSIVVGSTLMAMLTMTGLWTLPLLLAEVVALVWHRPVALPFVLVGVLPLFAVLALAGRIMDDLFDLVAGDRRLRALMLVLLSLPAMTCWLGQYVVQYSTDNYSSLPPALQTAVSSELWQSLEPGLAQMSEPHSVQEFFAGVSQVLEVLQPSRWLKWLPPGWATAGMGQVVTGDWGQALLALCLSVALVAGLLWVHAGITRRLMTGAAVTIGTERVRSRDRFHRLPGPPALWALFQKDWVHLWRHPMPRRLISSTLIMLVAILFPLRGIAQGTEQGQGEIPAAVLEAIPLLVTALMIVMTAMTVSAALTGNYFGTIDREGFATLALSTVDRRYVLLAANLATWVYALGLFAVISLGAAILTKIWVAFPFGMYLGLCLQIGGAPAYNLAAIIGPYRTQLRFSSGRRRGNLWGLLAWAISAPPVVVLIVLPYVLWRSSLFLVLPLGAVYCLAVYLLTLKPLARLLQRREHTILQAVIAEE